MPTAGTHHKQEGTASPESAPPEEARGRLDAMRRQLEQHLALKNLGPLFDSKAQGQEPLQKPPRRSQ